MRTLLLLAAKLAEKAAKQSWLYADHQWVAFCPFEDADVLGQTDRCIQAAQREMWVSVSHCEGGTTAEPINKTRSFD